MMQFESFLVEEGLLTEADVVKAMDRQRELAPPIGKIALAQRVLTVRQVFQILNEQATSSGSKFGELAVRMGFMTARQVEGLLKTQRETRPSVAEIVVQMGLLSRKAVDKAMARFRASQIEDDPSDLPSVPNTP